jgi:hypothetical protein
MNSWRRTVFKTCQLCEKHVLAKGLCSKHYNRVWRYGDPQVRHGRTGRALYDDDRLLLSDDFWEKVKA